MTQSKPFTHTLVLGVDDQGRIPILRPRKKPPNLGMRNLPGGKVEPNENPVIAAVREFYEETGCHGRIPALCGVMEFPDKGSVIGCYNVTPTYRKGTPEEPLDWMLPTQAVHLPDLIENLKIVVPLLANGVTGWTYTERDGGHHITF